MMDQQLWNQKEPEPPHIKKECKEPESPQIKVELEELEPPQIIEEQKASEFPHIKEEVEELYICQVEEEFVLNRATDTFMEPLTCEKSDHIEPEPNIDLLHSNMSPGDKIQPNTYNNYGTGFSHCQSMNHNNNVLLQEKPYSCKLCNKTFKQSNHLMSHMSTHKCKKT